jgi:hypothetical protein
MIHRSVAQRATSALLHAYEAGPTHLETSGVPASRITRITLVIVTPLLPAPLRRDLAPRSKSAETRFFLVDVTRHWARLSIVVSAFYSGAGSPLLPMVGGSAPAKSASLPASGSIRRSRRSASVRGSISGGIALRRSCALLPRCQETARFLLRPRGRRRAATYGDNLAATLSDYIERIPNPAPRAVNLAA